MGEPFYARTRTFVNNVAPPGVGPTALNEYEAAHQAASDRVVSLERATIVTQTANFTLAAADELKLIRVNSAAGVTVTVPLNATVALPAGWTVDLLRYGAGGLTVAGAAGVDVRSAATLSARAQYSGITLLKIATNEWWLTGDLA